MVKLPITTQKKSVEIKTINGQPVFDLREQILSILGRDADPALLRDFFAEPVINEVKGEVSWYTQASGPVRPFRDLDSGERERIYEALQKIDGKMKASAERVAKAGNQLGWLIDAARAMLSSPGLDESLFVVGSTTVLAQWGCIPFGSDPARHQIIVSDTSSRKIIVGDTLTHELHPVQLPAAPAQPEPLGEMAAAPTAPIAESWPAPVDEPNQPPPNDPDEEHNSLPSAPMARHPFNWRDHIPALISLVLLLLLIIGTYLNYRYTDAGRLAAIDMADAQIEQLWGNIALRAQQCQPPAVVPTLDQITQEEVERDLQQEAVNIGKSLNVSLAWSAPVDLDLAVLEPSGARIYFEKPASGTSGKLDIDANRKEDSACKIVQGRNPVENISWDRPAPSGIYEVEVNLFSVCAVPSPGEVIPFTLFITRAGQAAQEILGEVSASSPTFSYSMELP